MRNKLLRVIFPDRGATGSNNTAHLPVQGTTNDSFASFAQAFSQLAGAGSGNSGTGVGTLVNAAGTPLGGNGAEVFDTVSKNLDRLRAVTESQVTETQANTSALSTNTAAKGASQALSAVSSATGGLFGGLSALPLVSGLLKLFGGSGTPQPQPPLPKYTAPAALVFDENSTSRGGGTGFQQASYDRFGNPRTNFSETPSVPDYASLLATARSSAGGSPSGVSGAASTNAPIPETPAANIGAPAANQITVNIQAMDSRSFLDRSQDIAQAVREAMLNMHSINDVVNDL